MAATTRTTRKKAGAGASTLRVRLVKGWAGATTRQRLNLRALGLRRTGDVNELPDSASVRGAIGKVAHLVAIEAQGAGK